MYVWVMQVELTQGKVALIDAEDAALVNQYKWCAVSNDGNWYAKAWVDGKTCYMHRLLLQPPEGTVTDHINGDGLDNRRSNLRACSHRINMVNRGADKGGSSRYKGVNWHKSTSTWMARLMVKGRRIFLGRYKDEIEAALAYDKAALELLGEEAWTNF